jgi:hypothetical protein
VATSTLIEKSCYFISNVSCYDVAKNFASPALAAIAVVFSVFIAFKQLSKQHQNTLNAQKEEAKRNTRIELLKDISLLLDQSSVTIREVNSYCFNKKYSNLEMKAQIDHAEYLELMKNFSKALLAVVSKVESYEIVNLKLFRVFRFALQSIHHDFLALQTESDRFKILETIIKLTNDSIMYFADFQVCMQNMAYGEVFDSSVPHRVPADKRYKVITNDPENLDKLHSYFWRETNWGKNCIKYENEAKEKFSS